MPTSAIVRGATFVVVGTWILSELQRPLGPAGGLSGTASAGTSTSRNPGLYVVSDPEASQTAIRVIGRGPKAGHVDRLAARSRPRIGAVGPSL